MHTLVQSLFDGPIDVVGDVHGELDALRDLLRHLDYDLDGSRAQGRRLVFLGDLTDRGPDSLGVVVLVQSLVESGRAQCVLGNHDLNILLDHRKPDNAWFFEKSSCEKGRVKDFFTTLPLALEREDTRVVHACWDPFMIEIAQAASCAICLYETHRLRIEHVIEHDIKSRPTLDDCGKRLELQNRNPVKVLTSGLERRVAEPFQAGGKLRCEERVPWWEGYRDRQTCIYGHYAATLTERCDCGTAWCVDFSAGHRWKGCPSGGASSSETKLAALRLPEQILVFNDGTTEAARF